MVRNLKTTDVTNPTFELKMYGPGTVVNPSHESGIELDFASPDPVTGTGGVSWVWTGMAEGNWAITLKDKENSADLSAPLARIRWRVRMRGVNELRPVIKLADGTMLVGDYTEPASTQWRTNEFFLVDVPRWRVIDPKEIIGSTDAAWRVKPDLQKVRIRIQRQCRRGPGLAGNSGRLHRGVRRGHKALTALSAPAAPRARRLEEIRGAGHDSFQAVRNDRMKSVDSALLDVTERICRRFQVWTGRTTCGSPSSSRTSASSSTSSG